MSESSIIRASEIGMYTYCAKSYLLLKAGVSPQQTLQDLIEQKKIPPVVVSQLQQKNIPLSTTIDKVLGQGLLPQKVEKEIIKSNIMLMGTAKHMDIGKQTQAGIIFCSNKKCQDHFYYWSMCQALYGDVPGEIFNQAKEELIKEKDNTLHHVPVKKVLVFFPKLNHINNYCCDY